MWQILFCKIIFKENYERRKVLQLVADIRTKRTKKIKRVKMKIFKLINLIYLLNNLIQISAMSDYEIDGDYRDKCANYINIFMTSTSLIR